MTTNPFILDMLGETLKEAVIAAQVRTGDDTVMARIERGLVDIERGDPAEVLQSGLSLDAAVAFLGEVE